MTNLNAHLNIPAPFQAILQQIEDMPLHLAEIAMDEHPKLPQFNRYLQVTGIGAKSKNEFIYFNYEQVLKDEDTGEEVGIQLSKPEWVVYAPTWSYFLNSEGKAVELPLQEDYEGEIPAVGDTPITKLRVPSYRYMLWLMKHHNAKFLELIEGYAADFIIAKKDDLDKL